MADLENQAAHPIDAKREVLKEQALALRIARSSYRQIARAIGVSVSTAHELVIEALEEHRAHNEEQTQELRRLEVALLDELTVRLWPVAPRGSAPGTPAPRLDARTADTITRISERRSRLLGLDAPQRWEGSGPGGGPFPVAAGTMDLTKLSIPELRQLEAIYRNAGALPAGEQVGPPAAPPVAPPAPPEKENA